MLASSKLGLQLPKNRKYRLSPNESYRSELAAFHILVMSTWSRDNNIDSFNTYFSLHKLSTTTKILTLMLTQIKLNVTSPGSGLTNRMAENNFTLYYFPSSYYSQKVCRRFGFLLCGHVLFVKRQCMNI